MATESRTRTGTPAQSTSVLGRLSQSVSAKGLLTVYVVLAIVFVYAPILSLIAFSFNAGGLTFPFVGFSLRWYGELFSNASMMAAIGRSLQLALVVTIITTVLSTATALAYRYEFAGRRLILYLLIFGIITPGITFGIGATLLLNEVVALEKGLWLATTVHVVWTLPFAVIVLLAGFPPTLANNERAARVMGANRLDTFREITLPQIAPTVLGAAVFAFTLSYNEATRSLLLVGQSNTMPIEVFAIASSKRATPMLFALGSTTTVISTLLLVVAGLLIFYGAKR